MSSASALPAGSATAGDAPGLTRATTRLSNRQVLTAGTLILLVPNILLAVQLRPLPAAIILAGATGLTALLHTRPVLARGGVLAQPVALPRLAACLVLAFALLILGGEAHLAFANWDWLWRDAVLADLARGPFPPTYQVAGETFFLRAPLGMYMLPALVAKTTSLGLGHAALLVQNALLLTLTLYMLATIAGRRAALAVVVFLSFSGLDVVGELLMWLANGRSLSTFVLPTHIESWTAFQYSSVFTQLFWVPNHALPAYWLSLIVLLCARREASVGELGLAVAASLFWSPFAVIGTLPFGAWLFLRDARSLVASPRFWLAAAAAAGFVPVALYMQVDAAQVPHAFVLFMPGALAAIVIFLVVEIPHVAIVRAAWTGLDPSLKGILVVAILVLVCLPSVKFGYSGDLVMRGSIPALMILAFGFAQALSHAWDAGRHGLLAAGLAIVVAGAVTPAQELIRSLAFPAFAISDCNLVTVWKKLSHQPRLDTYLAHRSPLTDGLIGALPASSLVDRPAAVCWPDIPFDPRLPFVALSNAQLRRDAAARGNGGQ